MIESMSLKYKGAAVDDGSIDINDLVSGLEGLVGLSSVILDAYHPSRGKEIPLRVKAFKKGSFESVLVFIESHPVLMGSLATIVASAICGLAYYFAHNKTEKLKINEGAIPDFNEEARKVIETIIRGKIRRQKVEKFFYKMAMLLDKAGIDAIEFGLTNKTMEIINQDNKDCFIDEKKEVEIFRKAITLEGRIQALDKRTLNGKFMSSRETYPIFLIMDNVEDYFHYFNEDNITISGVAICERDSNRILKIEVARIARLSRI